MAKDLTQGPITGLLFKLAFPGVFSLLGMTVNHFIDGIWVGKIGPEALAAIAPAAFATWIVFSFVEVMPVGMVALISRFYGEKNFVQAGRTTSNVLKFVILISVLLTLAGALFSRHVFVAVGVSAQVVKLGTDFLTVFSLGLPAIFISEIIYAILRAVGDTTTPMKLTLAAIAVNMILDPLLIFGLGPFPKWGMAGAALATVIGYYVALFLAIRKVAGGVIPFGILSGGLFAMDSRLLWRVARIGIPISISGIIFSLIYLILAKVASPFGDFAVASFRVGQLVESVSYMVCFGFAQATASMVGQNLGARLPDRAQKTALVAQLVISGFTLCISFILYYFAWPITSIFTSDLPTTTAAVNYLKIIALSQVFMGFEVVLEGAFSGAGDTFPPMIVSIVGTTLRIPLAILLTGSLGFGYLGLYWAITISTVLKGIVIAVWFNLGRWKAKQI